ncbi:MAG: hypothetical protein IPP88_02300 [Betaproteobacteria bacterium]|nr:hypothetical protein [Betaproteobacteria bacterium]
MSAVDFENAVAAIETWLDGAGAAYATRAPALSAGKRLNVWTLQNVHPVLMGSAVELMLPRDFPVSAPRINVDKSLCLVLPHVEETGQICLGVEFSPTDFENPIGAVERALQKLRYFLTQCEDSTWIKGEFQKERVAYWTRFCDKQRKRSTSRPAVVDAYVYLHPFSGHTDGRIAVYKKGKLAVVCMADGDPLKSLPSMGCPKVPGPGTCAVRPPSGIGAMDTPRVADDFSGAGSIGRQNHRSPVVRNVMVD